MYNKMKMLGEALESPFLDHQIRPLGSDTDPSVDGESRARSEDVDALPEIQFEETDAGEPLTEAFERGADERATDAEALDEESTYEQFQDPPDLSAAAADALQKRDWPLALKLAIQQGFRDENNLTNRLFFARHPELPNKTLDKKHRQYKKLSREWRKIRDREVWPAIQASAENTALVVPGKLVAAGHRLFWDASGKRFKKLVEKAAKDVDLNPGLLAANLLAETARQDYLTSDKVSSYVVGVDDFYERRAALKAAVPAYSKVGWDKNQTPDVHLNDAQSNPREVKTIEFDSGPDALLASAVYLKHGEIRLREAARKLGGDFDALPLETRWALIRMAFAAGVGKETTKGVFTGATKRLARALKGEDILVRKNIDPKAYQTDRNATIRTAQAMHLSEWIFGVPVTPAVQTQPETVDEPLEEAETNTDCTRSGAGIIGRDDRRKVANPLEIPCRWICQLWISQEDSDGKITETGATGVLISPRHVLTVAHAVRNAKRNDRNQWVTYEARAIRVTPARDGDDRPLGTYDVKLPAKVAPRWDPKGGAAGHDYALLTLEKSIGDETFKKLGRAKLCYWGSRACGGGARLRRVPPERLEGRTAITAGYPHDRGRGKTPYITTGQLTNVRERNRTMLISADACQGQSGSPIWINVGGQHCMVGMMVLVTPATGVALRVTREFCRQLRQWLQGASDVCAEAAAGTQDDAESEATDDRDAPEFELEDRYPSGEWIARVPDLPGAELDATALQGGFGESKEELDADTLEDLDDQDELVGEELDEEDGGEFVPLVAKEDEARRGDPESPPPDGGDGSMPGFELEDSTGKAAFAAQPDDRFIVLVSGFNFREKNDDYDKLARNRARVVAGQPGFKNDDNLVFVWFSVAEGRVFVNRRKNGIWKLRNTKDWTAIDEFKFSNTSSQQFSFEAIDKSKHYGGGTVFLQDEPNDVMSILNVYEFVANLGRHRKKRLMEMSIISHGFWNGPILVNSSDKAAAGSDMRDPSDKDGRGRKDFKPANLSASVIANIRDAFHADGFSWIWGCFVAHAPRAVIQGVADSKSRKTGWGKKVRGLNGFRYLSNGKTPDTHTFRFSFGKDQTEEFSEKWDASFFAKGVDAFEKTFAEIKEFAKKHSDDTYCHALAVATDKKCFGAPLGSSTNYASKDPYRRGTPVVHWVERGAKRPAPESKPGKVKYEANYSATIEFFVNTMAMPEDPEGRGYVRYSA